MRTKCNVHNQMILITNNLTSGYHKGLQLVKETIVPAIQDMKACLEILTFSLKEIQIHKNILDNPKYDYLFSVDTLNELVQNGMPFRDAYKKMGQKIQKGIFKPKRDIEHSHEGSLGDLCLKEIRKKMDTLFAK